MATQGRGQALVEFALILPILLVMVLGTLGVGLLEIERFQLTHAASEGAIAGASTPGNRCADALTAAVGVLGYEPTSKSCALGARVAVSLAQDVPLGIPFLTGPWRVAVTMRAEIRP